MIRCTGCGGTYDEIGFRKRDKPGPYAYSPQRLICLGCEQEKRDKIKQANRARSKVNDVIRRHADKFIKKGTVKSRSEFVDRFDWDIDRMLHDLEHAYKNGCPYCDEPFSGMGHGWADITLDICDPRQDPFYGVNTRWVCGTCNRQKGKTPPEKWGAKQVYFKQWNRWKANLVRNPYLGLPLYENLSK